MSHCKGCRARCHDRSGRRDNVIYLRERSITMVKRELIVRNPLRILAQENGNALKEGEFGAVLARAGVGKTSFLVQLALDSLLTGKNVLHISLDQPVKKVTLWYDEVFQNIAESYQLDNSEELWETILPHRFIMTFQSSVFSADLLEQRLADLTEQGIFYPQITLIDGLKFDDEVREVLSELKLLAKEQGFPIWFAIRTHRDEPRSENGLPISVDQVEDLFEAIIELNPTGKDINVTLVKGRGEKEIPPLQLDPATLLIKDGNG